MNNLKTSRAGMAIVVVLVFAMALLVLGGAYIKTISQKAPVNPVQLEKIQADFFAQGIFQIALLKFKRFTADFYHAYIRHKQAIDSGPYYDFIGTSSSPLQSMQFPTSTPIGQPTGITAYTTGYEMVSFKGYDNDGLVINVNVTCANPTPITLEYSFKFNINRYQIIP